MPGSLVALGNLPATVERVLDDFLEAARAAFGRLAPGTAGPTLFRLLRLAERMRARALALR